MKARPADVDKYVNRGVGRDVGKGIELPNASKLGVKIHPKRLFIMARNTVDYGSERTAGVV